MSIRAVFCHISVGGQWTETSQLSDEKVSFYSLKTWYYVSIRYKCMIRPAIFWTSLRILDYRVYIDFEVNLVYSYLSTDANIIFRPFFIVPFVGKSFAVYNIIQVHAREVMEINPRYYCSVSPSSLLRSRCSHFGLFGKHIDDASRVKCGRVLRTLLKCFMSPTRSPDTRRNERNRTQSFVPPE